VVLLSPQFGGCSTESSWVAPLSITFSVLRDGLRRATLSRQIVTDGERQVACQEQGTRLRAFGGHARQRIVVQGSLHKDGKCQVMLDAKPCPLSASFSEGPDLSSSNVAFSARPRSVCHVAMPTKAVRALLVGISISQRGAPSNLIETALPPSVQRSARPLLLDSSVRLDPHV